MPNIVIPTIHHWLILAVALFAIGMYGMLTRRSAVGVLMAVELLLNSAALTFMIFNHHLAPAQPDGQIMAIFIIAVAAAEVVVGMAIFVALYRTSHTVDVNQLHQLRNG